MIYANVARDECGCSAIGPAYIDISVTAGAVFYIAGESAIASRRVPLGQLPVLSRLISLLRRIPAVKWAFTRLRPLPQSSSIDDAARAAEGSIVAEAAPARGGSISTNSSHCDADIEIASDEADAPELVISSDPPAELVANVEPFVLNEAPVSHVEADDAPVDTPELISNDRPAELLATVESVV